MKYADLNIDALNLPTRAEHIFHRKGFHTLGQIVQISEEEMYSYPGMGAGSITRTMEILQGYRNILDDEIVSGLSAADEGVDVQMSREELLSSEEGRQKIRDILDAQGATIRLLADLPAREYNMLLLAGYKALSSVVFMSADEIARISRFDAARAEIVRKSCAKYVDDSLDSVLPLISAVKPQVDEEPVSVPNYLDNPDTHDMVIQYFQKFDLPLAALKITQKLANKLIRMNCTRLSEVLSVSVQELYMQKGTGRITIDEFVDFRNNLLEEHDEELTRFISGDRSVLFTEESLCKKILTLFDDLKFQGLHYPEIREIVDPEQNLDDVVLKKVIGKLIAEKKLEYVDYRCFRVYPSVLDYVDDEGIDERKRYVFYQRLTTDRTLEEISGDLSGVTREWVRQTEDTALQVIRKYHTGKTGSELFSEDYYQYFYETYAWNQKEGSSGLGVSKETYEYLRIANKKKKRGMRSLEDAVGDEKLDVGLRLKIINYLNRNKIKVNGEYIPKEKVALENYVLMTYCQDDVSLEEFISLYNGFLGEHNVEDALFIHEGEIGTIKNKLQDSERKTVLAKYKKFRYYDIEARDYSELLSELNLEIYKNIGISTKKLMREHPDIMKRYDIRDHYELHNLLRKILPDGCYNNLTFGKNPMLDFGTFDKADAMLELVLEFAPISTKEFSEIVEDLYGYPNHTTYGTECIAKIRQYIHNGHISIDYKDMPDEHRKALYDALPEEPLTFSKIKDKYMELYPSSDPTLVNTYNLKLMGLNVYAEFALKNHNQDEYFTSVLNQDDFIDYSAMKERYADVFRAFYAVFYPMVKSGELIEMVPGQYVHMSKLEKSGITRDMLKEFCDDVYDFVNTEEYFSIKQIRNLGFSSALFDFGFEDSFFASVVKNDDRFSFNHMYGPVILYKGNKEITKRSFLESIIQVHGSIDAFDLMDLLPDVYGCINPEHSDMVSTLSESEIYYDETLDRFYANYGLFYDELE